MWKERKIIAATILLLLMWAWLWVTAHAQHTDELTWLVRVQDQQTYDFSGIQFFELRRGAEAAVVSIQQDSELAKFLSRYNHQRIVLRLEKPDEDQLAK